MTEFINTRHVSSVKGFTIIELVVVIIVLAILAVVATSQFIDVKRDAEISRVKAVAASFEQSVAFTHSRWLVEGGIGAVKDLPGYIDGSLDVNAQGYPIGVNKNRVDRNANIGPGQDGCVDLWQTLIESPPSVSVRNSGAETDFESYRHRSTENPTAGTTQCTYVLRTLGDTAGRNNAEIKIVYDSVEGTVTPIIEDS